MEFSKDSKDEYEKGEAEYLWAKKNMPTLNYLVNKYAKKKILENYNLGICLHITKETSVLLMGLKEVGAQISLCSANPLSIQDHIKNFLSSNDINIYAKKGGTIDTFFGSMDEVLNTKPQIITDDGGELHKRAIKKKSIIIAGTEETTSGVNRLRKWQNEGLLSYPIVAVNQSKTKHLFDNRYGTGQSTVEGILRTTGILLASKRIVVCGYGWVGKGVARCASGMGAKVTITEVNPIRALEAFFDGYEVKPLDEVVANGDIFITCTGQLNVINRKHFEKMKDKVLLCNAGHFDVEIDVNYLNAIDPNPSSPRHQVTCYRIDKKKKNKKIYLLAKGRVINLVGAEGNPPEVMSISFANQLLSIIYLSKFYKRLENRIYNTPKNIEKRISNFTLKSYGLKIDSLTNEQASYFNN